MTDRKEQHKRRTALSLAVIIFLFIIFLVTAVLSLIGVRFMLSMGVIPVTSDGHPSPQHALTVMFFTSLVVGFVVISITSHITLKYINAFINQMNRLASGDFKARLKYNPVFSKHPTVAEITDSFNRMAEELDNTKVLRSDFINSFSHEFKTPIVSIAGFAKLLRRGQLTERQKEEYMAIIEEESLRLSAMATNVLNVTKIENQTILSDITKFNLSEQIRNSILLLENTWERKKMELNVEFDDYEISGDEELLKHVWINLLDNAVKFSPDYGMLAVKITQELDTVTVEVANSGDEIPFEIRDKIFDKFYQGDESHSSTGNGIGLAIVKKVVELHNGTITVNCNNGITTFSVSLPFSK